MIENLHNIQQTYSAGIIFAHPANFLQRTVRCKKLVYLGDFPPIIKSRLWE